mgnify:CR=1 FL=1
MDNAEQIEHWNGTAGQQWAGRDDTMAALLAPFSEALMDHAAVEGARAALDIGCGGGSQTLALARRLGSEACVLGIDISAPLLTVAERRLQDDADTAQQVRFVQGDASAQDFDAAPFDLLFSRFGVMFFDDPAAAFAHLRGATTPGGRLAFCCWQELAVNPFVRVPLQAALSVLPPPPSPPPRAPGPFAFAERDYVEGLLQEAGWADVAVAPAQVPMRWAQRDDFGELVREMVNLGPIGRLLQEASEEDRERVYAASEELLAPFYGDGVLQMEGAVWMVTAQNGS